MADDNADPGTVTMREIDLFENRLQLKTLQEGLKHKVASVDITPNLVHGAVGAGISDYTSKFAGVEPELSGASAASGGVGNELSSSLPASASGTDQEQDLEKLPEIYPPQPPPPEAPQVQLRERLVLLDILHASNLEAPACYWKKGVSAMLCHPYCMVTYGQEIVRGKTVKNSRNPIIKDSIKLHAPLSGRLGSMTIAVYSEESAGSSLADTLIGTACLDCDTAMQKPAQISAVLDEGPVHKWLDLTGAVSGSIHISLSVQETV